MSEKELPKNKSRRRFLADLLFIGGGATAAAILAKSWTAAPPPPDPKASPRPRSAPKKTPIPDQPEGPYPGNAVFPDHLVETSTAPPPAALGEPAPQKPRCEEPMIEGRAVAPKSH